jgi:choline monooxygenase
METLPWEWYSSAEVLRLERERVFRGAWHYVGPAAKLEEPGSYLACPSGSAPLVCVRGRDGELRAFVNVCRHRGHEIAQGEGRRETLQCPYHAWTYDLDGTLRAAPRAGPGLDRSALSLLEGRAECWGPFVFANSDAEAPPLVDALGELPSLLARCGLDLDGLVFRERSDYALEANWKVAVENYLECYHCPVAHPDFSAVVDVDPARYLLERRDGLWSQLCERRDGEGIAGQFHLVWPALKVNVFPGVANLSIGPVWPVSPGRTAGFLDYFFGPEVSDEEAAELLALDEQVGREDAALVESVQRGVASGLVAAGTLLLPAEELLFDFQRKLATTLAAAPPVPSATLPG